MTHSFDLRKSQQNQNHQNKCPLRMLVLALEMARSSWSMFASISVSWNVITCQWTPSNRNREGWLLNAEVQYLLLYLKGSLEGSAGGERFNYVCTSTTAESADSRAQHKHSGGTAKSRTTPLSSQWAGHRPAELWDWSNSWIFNKSALWHARCLTFHHREVCADS